MEGQGAPMRTRIRDPLKGDLCKRHEETYTNSTDRRLCTHTYLAYTLSFFLCLYPSLARTRVKGPTSVAVIKLPKGRCLVRCSRHPSWKDFTLWFLIVSNYHRTFILLPSYSLIGCQGLSFPCTAFSFGSLHLC
ncbi:hypothetical protein KP509_06G049700 [Ceratopteris richardii]|uniref:Uncharacterized protein n=1 Tax=Ceratopteris richardii TaxID=49495 RepID=A0A8T2UMT3_CERRI|nr:hypothetical protein KP509_06G049700 [Ceratopteris richardii]